MARRPQGVQSFAMAAEGNAQIKTGPGKFYDIAISWSAASVGDKVIIRDGTDETGTIIFNFRVPTTAGSFSHPGPTVGRECILGIFLDMTTTASSNFEVSVGFD